MTWIEQLHPQQIKLGLSRVREVQRSLELEQLPFPVITVGGTNGKGSTIACLQSILQAAGNSVGSYTSPHLRRFNERVVINGSEIDDDVLCQAFETVDAARGDTALTYFEFTTLAAVRILVDAKVDIGLLEVGLGGRLDAVNAWDADVAIISSIGIDHTEWLGPDRDSIAREKAGIFRTGRPAICADPEPPAVIAGIAAEVGATLYQYDRDFGFDVQQDHWDWRGPQHVIENLPMPALVGRQQYRNAAAAIMALQCLPPSLACSDDQVRQGLRHTRLAGRFQLIAREPLTILDVAHNAEAATALAQALTQHQVAGETHAVVAMLANKDHAKVLQPLLPHVDHWHLASIGEAHAAGADPDDLRQLLQSLQPDVDVSIHNSIDEAWKSAGHQAQKPDRILVFGSFYTVGGILATAH